MLTHSSGLIFTSNWSKTGGISVITPKGHTTSLIGTDPHKSIKPNGIALEAGGSFLIAHLGDTQGGVLRLSATGKLESVVTHANGVALPPTNFVTIDASDRIWITVSTTVIPRANDYRWDAKTGFIAVAEPGQSNARIVADGLGYTNECVIDTDHQAVYLNETFARRLTRFDLADNGSLSNRSTVATFNAGTYPDGVALDVAGNLWVTSIVSNRIIKILPNGDQKIILEDADELVVEAAEKAYQENSMSSEHLAHTGDTTLKNTSSLAFGGNHRTTAYIGNLLDNSIHYFETTEQGVAPSHWSVPLGCLEMYLNQH